MLCSIIQYYYNHKSICIIIHSVLRLFSDIEQVLLFTPVYLSISEHAEDPEANEFIDSDLHDEIPGLLLFLFRFHGSERQPYFGLVKTLFAFGCTCMQACAISIGDF